jgi:hydroxymethylglutaryl-CoA reductase (NADPH)
MFPAFILAKLYVKGTLKNTSTGFEFTLKNIIDSTLLVGIGPISVEGKTYEGAALTMAIPDKTVSGAEISSKNSIPARMGIPIKVSITGEPLTPGQHKVSVAATTSDIGMIKFEINDTVA